MNFDNLKLYSVEEAMEIIDSSRKIYYDEIHSGRLKSVKRGRRRLHTPNQLRDYFDLLEKESEQQAVTA